MILAFAFIVYRLYQYHVDLSRIADAKTLFELLLLILCHAANIFFLAPRAYSVLVNLYAKKTVSLRNLREIYCKSNLYKYLPGNIMHFVGRNQIAISEQIPHTDVVLATVTEMVLLIVAACVITACSSAGAVQEYLRENTSVQFFSLLPVAILALVILAVLLGFLFKNKVLTFYRRYQTVFTRQGLYAASKVLLLCIVRLLVNAAIFLGCLSTLSGNFPVQQWGQALGLFVMSWVIGFITPGAPGGLGIREAIMCFFFAGILGEDTILYAALIYRVICVFGDMTSYVYVLLAKLIYKREKQNR